jgi:hypothetical protein
MANPTGDAISAALRRDFEARLLLQFCGPQSDANHFRCQVITLSRAV